MVAGGALESAIYCLWMIGRRLQLFDQKEAQNFASKVDFLLYMDAERKVVVEVESSSVFAITGGVCFSGVGAFRLDLVANAATVAHRVLNKLCLHMGAHKTQWGALTCHDRWIFVRLHKGTETRPAYITFSTVEVQGGNTRPFRALLGMMLATGEDVDVESHADSEMALTTIVEEVPERASPQSSSGPSDESYHPPNEGLSGYGGTRTGSPVLRSCPQYSLIPDILLSWSLHTTSANEWLNFYSISSGNECPSLGSKPALLRLQREIRAGSTGRVYEAKLDADGKGQQSYAIKIVKKGNSKETRARLVRLHEEFKIYCMIEKTRANGQKVNIAPRCYGLYETNSTVALVLDYVGEALPVHELHELRHVEKISLFNAIRDLHALGISHHDLAPRNIVRNPDGAFRIIDFASSTLHHCPGIRAMKQSDRSDMEKGQECPELKMIWRSLVKLRPYSLDILVT